MWNMCNTILLELDFYLSSRMRLSNRDKSLPFEYFYSICILYMVSRASKIARQSLLAKDDISFVVAPNSRDKVTKALEIKVLELLFDVVRSLLPFDPIRDIGEIAGKRYDKARYGTSLMGFVDACLFKSRLTDQVFSGSVEDMGIKIPLKINYVSVVTYQEDGKYY